MPETRLIRLTHIRSPRLVLRPVRRDSVDYLELRDSIQMHGVLNSILVRPIDEIHHYEVVDGYWRYTACVELGLPEIPCVAEELTDEEVLAIQIHTNAIRPTTDKLDFARSLRRIQEIYPRITLVDLAVMVGKRPAWIKQQLSLLNLRPEVQTLVDRGEITIGNAYVLARIPPRYQPDYVEAAKKMNGTQFKHLATGMIRRVMEELKSKRLLHLFDAELGSDPDHFQPVAHLRKLDEAKLELDTRRVITQMLVARPSMSQIEIWCEALKWMLHLDDASVAEQRKRADQRHLKTFTKTDLKDLL